MNTATHAVEVPFPQAFPGLAPWLFPSAPRYRPMVDKRNIRPLGGKSAPVSRDVTPVSLTSSLVVTLMLLPKGAIYFRTQRNMIQLSKYWRECSTLTHICQVGILFTWASKQNIRPCGSPRKIWQPLHELGNSMPVSQIQLQYGWLCRLSQDKSRLPITPLQKGTIFHPPVETWGFQIRRSVM